MIAEPKAQEETGEWEALFADHDAWLRRRVREIMKRVGLRPRGDHVGESIQEVYCRLLEGGQPRLQRLRGFPRSKLLSYLGRVAESVILDQIRAARAAKRGGRWWIHPARKCAVRLVDPDGDPERVLLRSERRRLLARHLLALADVDGLARRDVRILWLAVVEGWQSREIGRLFELKPRTVDTRLHHIRRRLAHGGLELPRR